MKFINYIKEAYNELVHKVTWPTWAELQTSSIVVMVASAIIAVVILLMDLSFENLLTFVYDMFY